VTYPFAVIFLSWLNNDNKFGLQRCADINILEMMFSGCEQPYCEGDSSEQQHLESCLHPGLLPCHPPARRNCLQRLSIEISCLYHELAAGSFTKLSCF